MNLFQALEEKRQQELKASPYKYETVGRASQVVNNLLDYLTSAQRTQQLQGLGGILEATGIPKTLERIAYGEPLTTGSGFTTQLKPETQEALLTVMPIPAVSKPAAQAAERGAMALGRAGERYAERVVPELYAKGGLTREMLEALGTGTQSRLTVYHGSPAKFTQFDASKIGSGEGAQAYGYGHYVAESPEVAREYQKNVSSDLVEPAKRALQKAGGNVDDAIQAANNEIKRLNALDLTTNTGSAKRDALVAAQMSTIDELSKFKKSGDWTAGSLYQIDLPDEQIAKMLDWDKPISGQPKAVQNALKNSDIADIWKSQIGFDIEHSKPQLDMVYKVLSEKLGSQDAASQYLKKAGIPGIRYLDQGSRGVGEGTSNFVVFPGNEGLLTIQKRNNEVLAPKGLLDTSPKLSEPITPQSLLDYRGSHTAPGPDFGAPLHDLTGGGQMYPADVYSSKAVQYYGTGYPKADKEAFAIAMRVKGNPDAEVTMYRAVPNDKSITNINEGDWVTLSKDYAKTHGESALQGNYKIISKKVKAKELYTNADSIHEFGYHPSAPTRLLQDNKKFNVTTQDASEIFGAGAKRIRYQEPNSQGFIDVLQRPDGTASVLGLEVPEHMRGKGIGQSLQSKAMQDFPEMMGQVSSKAAAKTAYRLGRRPPNMPDASLEDVYKIMDEYSSVNLVSPEMQKRMKKSLLD